MFTPPDYAALQNLLATTGGVGATYTGGAFIVGERRTLATTESLTFAVTTGDFAVVIDPPVLNTNSGDVTFVIYEDSDYSGGTPVTIYNNDRTSGLQPQISNIVADPTINDIGTQVIPVIEFISDNHQTHAESLLLGYPFVFAPNKSYILQITHQDGQSREVNVYIGSFRRIT